MIIREIKLAARVACAQKTKNFRPNDSAYYSRVPPRNGISCLEGNSKSVETKNSELKFIVVVTH